MFVYDLLFSLGIALLMTAVFVYGLRRTGPWANTVMFFVIVFLSAWAGGLWITPAQPYFPEVYWVSMFFVALLVSILIAAATSPEPPSEQETEQGTKMAEEISPEEESQKPIYDLFFWALVLMLTGLIVTGYLSPIPPQ